MKKTKQLIMAIMAVVLLGAGVSGCGQKEFDAAGYTEASFKASFHQDYDDYAKFRNLSKEKAKKEVEDLNRESIIAQTQGLELNDKQKEAFYQATMKCYSKVKFEVGEAKKGDDGNYTVSLTYEPVDCFIRFASDFQDACANRPDVLTDPSKLADFMNEFLLQCADNVTYGDKETMSVVVEKQDKGYQISQSELEKADAAFSGMN